MFLTFTEAQRELRVSHETLRRLIKSGEVTAHKTGTGGRTSHYRVDASSVKDYIKRRSAQTVKPVAS